jgi:hypothetical protein
MSEKSESRARRFLTRIDRIASDINPLLLGVALGLACMDVGVFLVSTLYGGPPAVMLPHPATEYALPAAKALNESSRDELSLPQ